MVRARIHIICGNCGCNDEWKLSITMVRQDNGIDEEPEAVLKCKNCGTLHFLGEFKESSDE